MKTPEGYEKDEVKKYLDSIGAYHFWPVQTGIGAATVDCLACIDGYFWAIEVKKDNETGPTKRQARTLAACKKARSMVVCGDARYIIDTIRFARGCSYENLCGDQ